MRLFINGLAASAGGGLTYLRNVIPHLTQASGVEPIVSLSPQGRRALGEVPHISVIECAGSSGALFRLLGEQRVIPGLIRRHHAQVLVSTGNFALWNSPVPQILLSRNSLYTSADFSRDVRARRDYRIWADTMIKGWLARRSIAWADVTVAPSNAFAQELRQWSGKNVIAIHHGFDPGVFAADPLPLPSPVREKLDREKDSVRLLCVSHYNYYRNFETLIRGMPILKQRLNGIKAKLFLTCRLSSKENPGHYRAEAAAALVSKLGVGEDVIELGAIPYGSLHHLYRACNIYVSAAYTETFAHPLVEAMSCGLPVVVADLPVHREICGDAAVYFPRFSPEALTDRVIQIHESRDVASRLSANGLGRAQDFSWKRHVDQLVALASKLVESSIR